MNFLLAPLFLCLLFLKVGWSLGRMLATLGQQFLCKSALVLAISTWVLITISLVGLHNLQQQKFASSQASLTTINQQINFWETQRQLQPTHRDILANLAKLNAAAGNTETTAKYSQQAFQVDPNHK